MQSRVALRRSTTLGALPSVVLWDDEDNSGSWRRGILGGVSDEFIPSSLVAHTLEFASDDQNLSLRRRPSFKIPKEREAKIRCAIDWWVVHPQAPWLPYWMMLVVGLLLYNTIFIPFRVCFTINYKGSALEAMDLAVDCFFWLDILLHFRLGYYRRARTRAEQAQVLVLDPWMCMLRYARTWFIIDFVSVFPFDIVLEGMVATQEEDGDTDASTARLTRLVRLARLPRLLRLFKFLRARRFLTSWERPGFVPPSVMRLLTLLLWLAILLHVVACLIHLIHETEVEIAEMDTWLTILIQEGAVRDSTQDRYVAALYWSVMTLTTVGYGDVHAHTTIERLYAMICMMLGAFLFAYLLGNMQHLLSNFDDNAANIQAQKDQINAWMRYRNLSPDLQNRVRSYFSFFWSRRNVFDEAAHLEALPIHLRKEVAMATNSKIISNIPFFGIAEDKTFIAEIVLRMRPVAAAAGDKLITAGEIGDEMFIVDSGFVEIVAPNGVEVYRRLTPGDFFGEIAILTKARRTASCRAATFCELWVLVRKDLQEVFLDYPEMHEQLTRYADGKLDRKMRYVRDEKERKEAKKKRAKADRIYQAIRSAKASLTRKPSRECMADDPENLSDSERIAENVREESTTDSRDLDRSRSKGSPHKAAGKAPAVTFRVAGARPRHARTGSDDVQNAVRLLKVGQASINQASDGFSQHSSNDESIPPPRLCGEPPERSTSILAELILPSDSSSEDSFESDTRERRGSRDLDEEQLRHLHHQEAQKPTCTTPPIHRRAFSAISRPEDFAKCQEEERGCRARSLPNRRPASITPTHRPLDSNLIQLQGLLSQMQDVLRHMSNAEATPQLDAMLMPGSRNLCNSIDTGSRNLSHAANFGVAKPPSSDRRSSSPQFVRSPTPVSE